MSATGKNTNGNVMLALSMKRQKRHGGREGRRRLGLKCAANNYVMLDGDAATFRHLHIDDALPTITHAAAHCRNSGLNGND